VARLGADRISNPCIDSREEHSSFIAWFGNFAMLYSTTPRKKAWNFRILGRHVESALCSFTKRPALGQDIYFLVSYPRAFSPGPYASRIQIGLPLLHEVVVTVTRHAWFVRARPLRQYHGMAGPPCLTLRYLDCPSPPTCLAATLMYMCINRRDICRLNRRGHCCQISISTSR
jgi:hypothetical protein